MSVLVVLQLILKDHESGERTVHVAMEVGRSVQQQQPHLGMSKQRVNKQDIETTILYHVQLNHFLCFYFQSNTSDIICGYTKLHTIYCSVSLILNQFHVRNRTHSVKRIVTHSVKRIVLGQFLP